MSCVTHADTGHVAVRRSVVPSLYPPPRLVAVEHELTDVFVALAAPVVATVAVVPPVAREALRTNRVRDDECAPAPENAAWIVIVVDVDALRRLQQSKGTKDSRRGFSVYR